MRRSDDMLNEDSSLLCVFVCICVSLVVTSLDDGIHARVPYDPYCQECYQKVD